MTEKKKIGFEALARYGIFPQEQLSVAKKGKHSFRIGLPREVSLQENRISLTPDSVALLVNNGHEVSVEQKAGEGATFLDGEYSEAGASIAYSKEEVYKTDIILKIEPPTFDEIKLMKHGQILVSALQSGNLKKEYIQHLLKKGVTALAYEYIEDKEGGIPVVRTLSEIAGSIAVLIASEYLSSIHKGQGIVFGGVTGVSPAKMVIIGAGTVAEYCARVALSLGADIRVFDNHIYKLQRIKHILGRQFYTSTIDGTTLGESLKTADVVVGALRAEQGRTRHVVSEDMVAQMKPRSLIIDFSIDQGGCIATSEVTSHAQPVFEKYGVIHYCVPNAGSRVARTTASALSNIFTPILLQAAEAGGIEGMMKNHTGLLKGTYTYRGNLANKEIAKKFNMKYKDIDLLIAANI